MDSASISSFTSEASAEAADGRQVPVLSASATFDDGAAAIGTCISDCIVCTMPPDENADCTGTLITAGELEHRPAPPTTMGLGGLGASTLASTFTSDSGTQSPMPPRQHSESGPISPASQCSFTCSSVSGPVCFSSMATYQSVVGTSSAFTASFAFSLASALCSASCFTTLASMTRVLWRSSSPSSALRARALFAWPRPTST